MAFMLLASDLMITVLVILGFLAIGTAICLITAATAPVGYQDETGFHFGPERDECREQFACAVTEPKLA